MSPLLILLTIISSSPLAASLGVEVEDVTGRQLEAALQTEELVAVMFCKSPQLFPGHLLNSHSSLGWRSVFISILSPPSVVLQTQTNHHTTTLPPLPSPLHPCYSYFLPNYSNY